jgi:predicted nucleic acid-binding protein
VITAIDTNVLLDVFGADPTFGPRSRDALQRCIDEGRVIANEVVWAEIGACFPSSEDAAAALEKLAIHFTPTDPASALAAGSALRVYRRRGGPRTRVLPDFLIGAHALAQADRLLTRDAKFHRSYFPSLQLLDPSSP